MNWYRTKAECCQGITFMTTVRRMPRGNPPKVKASQMVLHVDGENRYWHWRDQVDRLAAGYGRNL